MLTGSWYSVDPDTAKLSVMSGDSHVLAVDVFDEFSQIIAVIRFSLVFVACRRH